MTYDLNLESILNVPRRFVLHYHSIVGE